MSWCSSGGPFSWLSLFYLLRLLPVTTSSNIVCPTVCTCDLDIDDSTIQNVSCVHGNINDRDLAHILSALPETVSSISVVGPTDNPNKFRISEDFARFYYLEELSLVNCGLGSLGKSIFAQNKHLRKLDVSFNSISHLSPDTFDGMEHIQILDLSNNDLWMDYMATGTFVYLKGLRSLNLSNNQIAHFPSNLFGELLQLNELILDNNFPDVKDLHILNQLLQLEHLSLAGCNVSYLPAKSFIRHSRMKRLNLSRNYLRTIEIPALKYVLHVEELDLSYNGITEIPGYFLSMFPNLRLLNLAGNHLGVSAPNYKFSSDIFARTNVTWLDLGENRFRSFETDSLGDSRSTIRSLSLSGNKLAMGNLANITRDLTALTELHLSGIGLTRLPDLLPPEFYHLEVLNLSRNLLHASIYDILPQLEELKVLDISYCDIATPPPLHFINFLSKLRAFYIHDNNWDCSCDLAPLRDFLRQIKSPSVCHQLQFARIQCSSPVSKRGEPIALAKLYGGCDVDANETNVDFISSSSSSGQLVINTEISILIAGISIAIFIVIAFIIGIACSQLRPQASYRTNEDKVNLSGNNGTGGMNGSEPDDATPSAAPVGGLERLF